MKSRVAMPRVSRIALGRIPRWRATLRTSCFPHFLLGVTLLGPRERVSEVKSLPRCSDFPLRAFSDARSCVASNAACDTVLHL